MQLASPAATFKTPRGRARPVMGLKATTAGTDDLKAIISAVSTLVEEATFVANAEGITFRGMDPSHVALIDITWPNSAFEKYSCDSEVRFGVKIDELAKLIKRASKKDTIEIRTVDSMLGVTIGKSKKFKIRLIETSEGETPLPNISYDTKISMEVSHFEKTLGDVDVLADYATITTEGTKSEFAGKGESGEASVEISEDDEAVHELSTKEKSSATYSLEYLLPIVKAVGSAAQDVKCEYSTAKPLRMEFRVSNIGRIHFYLAPRVDS